MRIVCQQTILMKYYALFVIFEKAAKFEMSSAAIYVLSKHCHCFLWECSGSVVECLTQDQGAPGLSLIGVTALCP